MVRLPRFERKIDDQAQTRFNQDVRHYSYQPQPRIDWASVDEVCLIQMSCCNEGDCFHLIIFWVHLHESPLWNDKLHYANEATSELFWPAEKCLLKYPSLWENGSSPKVSAMVNADTQFKCPWYQYLYNTEGTPNWVGLKQSSSRQRLECAEFGWS